MRRANASSNRSEITALIGSSTADLDSLLQTFFRQFLQSFQGKCWKPKIFSKRWQKLKIVKISKKGTSLGCDTWRDICVLPAAVKILSKYILERIKEYSENLIYRDCVGFRSGSFCTDHINTLQIIVEHCLLL